MSRGGRGGRGGYRGRGGPDMNTSGRALGIEVDPELTEAAVNGTEHSDNELANGLFPELDEVIMAAPLTDEERRELQIERDFQAKRQAGPFWSGSREEWEEVDAKKGGNFNPFEDAETYGKKRRKKPFQLANFKKVKVCYPEFMPKEIRDIVTDEGGEDDSAEQSKKKKRLGLTKKFAVDNLAKLDEGIDGTNAEPGHDAEEDVDSEKEDEEDGFEREAEDDAFEEDEDDADDDYNAEKYYDGGDDDLDDGDDYGEDGY